MIRQRAAIALPVFLVLSATPVRGVESGPQAAVRQFCQADGLGQRVSTAGWAALAPLVAWSLEPAWDHVVLIGSYEVGSPHAVDGGIAVDVRYAVIGQLSAQEIDSAVHLETVQFRMDSSKGGWRIAAPPLPPHIFGNRVDVDAMRQSLQAGGVNFLPNTVFIWQMFQSAGWNVPYVLSADLLNGAAYRSIDKPKLGDLAIYLRDGVPYHVGVFEADDRIVSSTLNAGIVRTAPDAFAGEMKYLRLIEPEPRVEEAGLPAATLEAEPAKPAPTRSVAAPRRRPSPAVKHGKAVAKSRHSRAQPSKRKRVTASRGRTPRKQPTPAATRRR